MSIGNATRRVQHQIDNLNRCWQSGAFASAQMHADKAAAELEALLKLLRQERDWPARGLLGTDVPEEQVAE